MRSPYGVRTDTPDCILLTPLYLAFLVLKHGDHERTIIFRPISRLVPPSSSLFWSADSQQPSVCAPLAVGFPPRSAANLPSLVVARGRCDHAPHLQVPARQGEEGVAEVEAHRFMGGTFRGLSLILFHFLDIIKRLTNTSPALQARRTRTSSRPFTGGRRKQEAMLLLTLTYPMFFDNSAAVPSRLVDDSLSTHRQRCC